MLRNMGNPRERLGHAMVSNETRVFVLGGKLATGAQADELALIHVLETSTYFFGHSIWTTSKFENRTYREPETGPQWHQA